MAEAMPLSKLTHYTKDPRNSTAWAGTGAALPAGSGTASPMAQWLLAFLLVEHILLKLLPGRVLA